jgi:ParB family chromosome partitioning protein
MAQAKLTDSVVEAICARKRADRTLSNTALAAEFNLNRKSIDKALMMMNATSGTDADTGISMLNHDQIAPSPLNPRKTFSEVELTELADSIQENGLLQNLVVRDGPDGTYILMAGERRWRAIGVLIAAGRWSGGIPCRVMEADDGTHLALALLENLQRQDVAPLEEADAFVQLQAIDPKLWSAEAIAAKIGRSKRYVYQRLSLANKLAPEAREALRTGRITIEAARMLTTASPEIQTDILDRAEEGRIETADISMELSGTLMDVEDALFDVEASGLEIIELEGGRYFADREAAKAAQIEAVKAKAKAIKKNWAFVEILPVGEWFKAYEYLSNKTKAQGGGVVIQMRKNTNEVALFEGVAKKPPAEAEPVVEFDRESYMRRRVEEQEAARAKREAEEAAQIEHFDAITLKLDSDWPLDHVIQPGEHVCNDGCKWRVLLNHAAPSEWHVCTKLGAPRQGLVTHENQGGRDCFEVA